MKNPLTLAGIEPATFRFVAQHPNHCATEVPRYTPVMTANTFTIFVTVKAHRLAQKSVSEIQCFQWQVTFALHCTVIGY